MKKRYDWIDNIRAFAIVNMILYHGIWDLVFLHDVPLLWFYGDIARYWQQGICHTFILLSGFCWSFSRNPLKSGIQISLCGILVTISTLIFSYNSRIIFGVLTLIGASSLILTPLEKLFRKIPLHAGVLSTYLMFAVTYGINNGTIGFFDVELLELPAVLYNGTFLTFIGFTDPQFFSTDYFSLIPWLFLYFTGYFLYRFWKEKGEWIPKGINVKIPVFTAIGRHSLLIYLLHQPILYALLWIVFSS